MKRKEPRRGFSAPGPGNMAVSHKGTELSCDITATKDGKSLQVTFTGGTEQKSRTIQIQGGSPVDTFCPSVEGTVILCFLKSGKEQIYDTLSGSLLSKENLSKRGGAIHFYS